MPSTIALAGVMFHPGWGPGWGFWFVPVIFWLLIIGLIVTLIVTRRRHWRRVGWGGYSGGPWGAPWQAAQAARGAEAVLAERFARGDIEEVEYRARLEVLRSQQPTNPQS